jgi:hypothetical protein
MGCKRCGARSGTRGRPPPRGRVAFSGCFFGSAGRPRLDLPPRALAGRPLLFWLLCFVILLLYSIVLLYRLNSCEGAGLLRPVNERYRIGLSICTTIVISAICPLSNYVIPLVSSGHVKLTDTYLEST